MPSSSTLVPKTTWWLFVTVNSAATVANVLFGILIVTLPTVVRPDRFSVGGQRLILELVTMNASVVAGAVITALLISRPGRLVGVRPLLVVAGTIQLGTFIIVTPDLHLLALFPAVSAAVHLGSLLLPALRPAPPNSTRS